MTKMYIDRTVVEQALEALENCASEHGHRCNRCDSEVDEGGKVVASLRTALAQQDGSVPEPMAWMYKGEPWFDGTRFHDQYEFTTDERLAKYKDENARPLYFAL